MNKEIFALKANERFRQAKEFWSNWRAQARDDYAFISGQQWLPEDEEYLRKQERPAVTFNYSEKMIDAIAGAEVSARQETNYAPRGVEDAPLAELWNSAAKWVRDNCNAEDEESDAFRDTLICGMGWTWTRMSYESDLDGEVVIERADPLEMYADPAARKPGLTDRRWHDRLWWVDEKDAQSQWPNAYFPSESEDRNGGVITRGHRYDDNSPEDDTERHKGQVQLRLHECYELEYVYRAAMPDGLKEFSEDEFKKFNAAQAVPLVEKIDYIKQRKRVYYRAFFAGDTLLEVNKSPCQAGFCFNCITGKRDRNRNTWYGLTRVMKDPQRWANKWLSQILHIINANAKGGVMAEVGAFVDPKRAMEEWSNADSVTMLKEGGIDKVKQKQQAPYPAGLDKLMTFALESLPMVTGINLEALGLANREQAGVLEQQRKQAAYGLLAPLFDALRRYRKEQGKVLLYYINNYISDGRMVRIGGPESQQYLPLTKVSDAPKYDIIVDQSPNSPDMKERTWRTLESIVPAMLKAGVPVPPDILEYAPLPTSLATKWKEFVGQQQHVNEEMQKKMNDMQKENESLKNDQQIKAQELLQKREQMEAELKLKAYIQQEEIKLEQLKAEADFKLEAYKQERQLELENRRMNHEQSMKQRQSENDFKLRAFTEGFNPGDDGKFTIDVQTDDLAALMQKFSEMAQQIMQQSQISSHMTAQALAGLQEALSRPRELVFDNAGRPVGSKLQ